MPGNEGGGENPPTLKRSKNDIQGNTDDGGGGEQLNNGYLPYFKPDYKRLYPENSGKVEFKVFVEQVDPKGKLGNKSPIFLNPIFTTDIKGVTAIQHVNANKIAVVFKPYWLITF